MSERQFETLFRSSNDLRRFMMSKMISKIMSCILVSGIAISSHTLATAQTTEYVCHRPAQEAGVKKNRIPQGKWWGTENTKNWEYQAIPGPDVYRHKRKRQTRATVCKRDVPRFNHGTRFTDLEGNQDWCGESTAAVSEANVTPSCPTGFSLRSDKKTCSKPATSATWRKNRHPQGKWIGTENTKNWEYLAIPGPDVYRHKKRRRTRATVCKRDLPRYNHGTRKTDFVGNQDWCATYIPGSPAKSVSATCGSGYSLVPVGTTNTGGSNTGGGTGGGTNTGGGANTGGGTNTGGNNGTLKDLLPILTKECRPCFGKKVSVVKKGKDDNYSGSKEATSPRALFNSITAISNFQSSHNKSGISRNYDEGHQNEYFVETIQVPKADKIQKGWIVMRFRDAGGLASTDNVMIGDVAGWMAKRQTQGNGADKVYARLFAKKYPDFKNEINPYGSQVWKIHQPTNIVYASLKDVELISKSHSGTSNLLEQLKTDGLIDVVIQDDTEIDFVGIVRCDPRRSGKTFLEDREFRRIDRIQRR